MSKLEEQDYIMEEKFRGKWIQLKGIRARAEDIQELNRDSFRTGVRYVDGKMKPAKEEKVAKEKPLADRTVQELKFYAEEKGIDLKDAKKKADILVAIQTAEK